MGGQGLRVVSLNDEGCSTNNFWLRMKKETGCCKNEYADPGTLVPVPAHSVFLCDCV
jgi:hypothetical protein